MVNNFRCVIYALRLRLSIFHRCDGATDPLLDLRYCTRYSEPLCHLALSLVYTNFFVTFLSWIYWLGAHAFNAAGHMGALL